MNIRDQTNVSKTVLQTWSRRDYSTSLVRMCISFKVLTALQSINLWELYEDAAQDPGGELTLFGCFCAGRGSWWFNLSDVSVSCHFSSLWGFMSGFFGNFSIFQTFYFNCLLHILFNIVSDKSFFGWTLRYPIHEKHSTIFYFQRIY